MRRCRVHQVLSGCHHAEGRGLSSDNTLDHKDGQQKLSLEVLPSPSCAHSQWPLWVSVFSLRRRESAGQGSLAKSHFLCNRILGILKLQETTTGGNTESAYGWIPSPASAFSKAKHQPSQQLSLSCLSGSSLRLQLPYMAANTRLSA